MDVRASIRGVYERVLTGVADILFLFFFLCMQLARVLTDIVKAPADVFFIKILKFLLSFLRERKSESEREEESDSCILRVGLLVRIEYSLL
jgi:hypothetical protein